MMHPMQARFSSWLWAKRRWVISIAGATASAFYVTNRDMINKDLYGLMTRMMSDKAVSEAFKPTHNVDNIYIQYLNIPRKYRVSEDRLRFWWDSVKDDGRINTAKVAEIVKYYISNPGKTMDSRNIRRQLGSDALINRLIGADVIAPIPESIDPVEVLTTRADLTIWVQLKQTLKPDSIYHFENECMLSTVSDKGRSVRILLSADNGKGVEPPLGRKSIVVRNSNEFVGNFVRSSINEQREANVVKTLERAVNDNTGDEKAIEKLILKCKLVDQATGENLWLAHRPHPFPLRTRD
jgi:hypothetical protein